MGYFPNGESGMAYEEKYCMHCAHYEGCAVWMAHMLHNYEECNKPESILHLLIPKSKDGLWNEKCLMFHQAPEGKHPDQYDLVDAIEATS